MFGNQPAQVLGIGRGITPLVAFQGAGKGAMAVAQRYAQAHRAVVDACHATW